MLEQVRLPSGYRVVDLLPLPGCLAPMVDDVSTGLRSTRRLTTGLAFIIFPLVFVFAFAGHPHLLQPRFLDPEALIRRAHGQDLLHLGHALVTLTTGLLVVAALHLMGRLEGAAPWSALVGAVLAIAGALVLAADKGALCLTMSALDTLPQHQFEQMMPGLLAMYSKQGWLLLLWGLPLLPLGFAVHAVALLRHGIMPRWQGLLFLVGVLFVGTPDGVEIVNLVASLMLAAAFVPYGVALITAEQAP